MLPMTQTPISKLRFYPGNARRGDIDLIADSLKTNGQYRPIVVCTGDSAPELKDTIIAGNHTTMAAQRLGWETIDAHYIDVDADRAKRIVLIDNSSNDKSTYDLEALVNLATELPDLTGTGFTRDELDKMLEALDNQFDDDETPEPPEAPDTYGIVVDCGTRDKRDTLKSRLLAEGWDVGNAD